ncbi:MAG: hypothetical protein K8F91_09060 [Candidatus Obscuribacterales bacterium]|nr:hypothetical protein [Candidatus Obscuribacterales bacterium]
MSEQVLKEAIENSKVHCPKCKRSVTKYEKYAETIDSVRDGFNVIAIDSMGARVTLICGNGECTWRERTEYWTEYLAD